MITASLVLYKSKPSEVQRVLECVENSSIDVVYVIDNSPTDELKSIITGHFEKAKYFYGQGNVGFGDGNNIGIQKAIENNSNYHVVLNPDIIFQKRVIDGLKDYMDRNPDIGLIKPALTNFDGSFMASAMMLPTPFALFGKRLLPTTIADRINYYGEFRDLDLSVIRSVPIVSGSFMFIRVDLLKQIGGFDNRYFMYFEDFDLARRIHKKSKVVYYPLETIIHAHAAEHRTSRKLFWISIKSAIKYFNKWGWWFDSDRRKWNKEARSENSVLLK